MESDLLKKLFSSVQRNIATLKKELEESEKSKKQLQKQVFDYLAHISPEESKRILGDHTHILNPEDKVLENVFFGLDTLSQEILGYSVKLKKYSIEDNEGTLLKNWIVEGHVGEQSFIVEFSTHVLEKSENQVKTAQASWQIPEKEKIVNIQRLDIYPQSEQMEHLSSILNTSDSLKSLIPSLYMLQKLQRERSAVEEALSQFREVEISEENDVLTIIFDFDSNNKVMIVWGFFYCLRSQRFMNQITVKADEEVKMKLSSSSIFPILTEEEPMGDAEEVLKFAEVLFSV